MLLTELKVGLFFLHWLTLLHLSKSAFIPLYEALVRPHLEYGMPACSPNLFRANSKISYRVGYWHSSPPYEERLQRRRLRVDLFTTFKILTGLLDVDRNFFFLPPTRRGLRRHSYKVIQGTSRRRGSASSVRVLK